MPKSVEREELLRIASRAENLISPSLLPLWSWKFNNPCFDHENLKSLKAYPSLPQITFLRTLWPFWHRIWFWCTVTTQDSTSEMKINSLWQTDWLLILSMNEPSWTTTTTETNILLNIGGKIDCSWAWRPTFACKTKTKASTRRTRYLEESSNANCKVSRWSSLWSSKSQVTVRYSILTSILWPCCQIPRRSGVEHARAAT